MKIIELNLDDSRESLIERVKKLEKLIEDIKEGSIQVGSPNRSSVTSKPTSLSNTPAGATSKIAPRKRASSNTKSSPSTKANPALEIDYSDALEADFSVLKDKWEEVLQLIKKRRISTHAFLIEGNPAYIEAGNLYIGFEDRFGFHMEAVSKPENKQEIERAIYQVLKYKLSIKCDYLSNLGVAEDAKEEEVKQEEEINEFFEGSLDKLDIKE